MLFQERLAVAAHASRELASRLTDLVVPRAPAREVCGTSGRQLPLHQRLRRTAVLLCK